MNTNVPRPRTGPLTVIVPLDGSATAEQALPYATALAKDRGGRIVLISIVDVIAEVGAWTSASSISLASVLDTWVAEREHYLETIQERSGDPQMQTIVRIGIAANEVRNVVRTFENPLIVMTSHGHAGAKRLFLGSVATKLVHDAGCPVMVIRQSAGTQTPEQASFRRVLVPLDGSSFGEAALGQATATFGDSLNIHLLRVVELPTIPSLGAYDGGIPLDYGLVGEYIDAVKEEAQQYLQLLKTQLEGQGHTVTAGVLEGEVASTILSVARDKAVDAIAIASHGRGGFSRLVFGSVAQRVLHEATLPLLLVRPMK